MNRRGLRRARQHARVGRATVSPRSATSRHSTSPRTSRSAKRRRSSREVVRPTCCSRRRPVRLVWPRSSYAADRGYVSAAFLARPSRRVRRCGDSFRASAVPPAALDLVVTYALKAFPRRRSDHLPILALIVLVSRSSCCPARLLPGSSYDDRDHPVRNPSSRSNGAPYLPSFCDLPAAPAEEPFELLRNTVYFDGHGTGRPLTILLYLRGHADVVLGFLDWFRSPEPQVPGIDESTAADAAAVSAPVGPVA